MNLQSDDLIISIVIVLALTLGVPAIAYGMQPGGPFVKMVGDSHGYYPNGAYARSIDAGDIEIQQVYSGEMIIGNETPADVMLNLPERTLLIAMHGNYFTEQPDCDWWYTYSMNNTFGCNNTLIESEDLSDLRVGDIISFNGSFSATHRINRIDGDCYYTKGDNNVLNDSVCVRKENIMRRIVGVLWTR